MTEQLFLLVIGVLLVNIFLSLVGVWRGPTPADRVVGTNLIGTKVMAIMALVTFYRGHEFYLDVALAYTLVGYIATICVAKYLETKAVRR